MEIKNIDVVKSPNDPNKVRLVGKVYYDDKKSTPELYWFEVDKKYENDLSKTGNPWLVSLIPLAVTLGEPLKICAPVDFTLFENIQELMLIWKQWYPELHIVPIEANIIDAESNRTAARNAAFFSGGVDSFFTALSHNTSNNKGITHIDDFLCIWGFDIPLSNSSAFIRMQESLTKVIHKLNAQLVTVATNLRETKLETTGWGRLYFGSALASAVFALENRYGKAFIASNGEGWKVPPWGSHPLTDPLFSTKRTKIIHDGLIYTRLEKTKFIADSTLAQDALRVCWKQKTESNCCLCSKCYRTMIALEALGALDKFSTFDKKLFEISKISKIYHETEFDIDFFKEIKTLALAKGRKDIANAINDSFKYSKNINKFLPLVKRVSKWLKNKTFIWRWYGLPERILLESVIT